MRYVQSVLFICAGVVLLINVVRLCGELWDWREARQLRQQSLNDLSELNVQRDRMQIHVEKLRTDELTKERLARRLGYVKPGEIIYKIVDPQHAVPGNR